MFSPKLVTSREPYQYLLLPSGNPPIEFVARHNQIYRFWKETWLEVLNGLKAESGGLADDFLRQDLIAAICTENGVAAVHLYSFFSLDADSSRQHHYLAGNYPQEYFDKLKSLGVRTVMSMEYLTVNPAWRKRKCDIHIGAALGGLGLKVMQYYGIDAAIAPARRDHKVHEMAYAEGGEGILTNVLNHNVPCDLIAIRRENVVPNPNPEVESLKNELWQSRVHVDARGELVSGNLLPFRKAA